MALVLQLRCHKGVKDSVVTSNKGSGTGAHAHVTPSPKVQVDRKGTPKPPSAPWPWPCCHGLSLGCPKSQSSHLESGPITLPCKEALPHPGEAAVHVCTRTHTCSAGVLKQGPLGIHTKPLLVPEQISEQFVVMKRHAPLSLGKAFWVWGN